MIEAEGPCGRREILARITREGIAVDGSLQRLRVQGKVSTVRSGRTSSYAVAEPSGEPDAPPEKTAADESAEA